MLRGAAKLRAGRGAEAWILRAALLPTGARRRWVARPLRPEACDRPRAPTTAETAAVTETVPMFVAANRFRVIPAETERFEAAWLNRESHIREVPGFVTFHLLRGPAAEDHVLYSSFTLWRSRADFEAWTRSEAFRRAHAGAGEAKPMTLGPPQFEGFDVLQTIEAQAVTT